jgi:hypothetical protein
MLREREHAPGPATTPGPGTFPHGQLRGGHTYDLARRPGMGSWTAHQPVTRRQGPGSQATTPVRGIDRIAGRPTQADRIPTRDAFSSVQATSNADDRPAFPLVKASVEPPAGIEPATPSLPWNHREPLCGTPFSQVGLDRRGRSYRFSFDQVMRSLSGMRRSSRNRAIMPPAVTVLAAGLSTARTDRVPGHPTNPGGRLQAWLSGAGAAGPPPGPVPARWPGSAGRPGRRRRRRRRCRAW